MNKDTTLIACLILATTLLSACETAPVAEKAPEQNRQTQFHPLARYSLAPKGEWQTLTYEEKSALQRKMNRIYMEGTRIISSEQHWRAKHEQVKSLLDSHEGEAVYGAAAQLVSLSMLEDVLLNVPGAEATQAVSYYTDLLVNLQSPDAAVIVPALDRLEGVWSRQRLSSARERVKAISSAYLDRQQASLDKKSPLEGQPDKVLSARDQRLVRIQSAIASL